MKSRPGFAVIAVALTLGLAAPWLVGVTEPADAAESERGDRINLVGLKAVAESISITLKLEGAEDFDLKAEQLRMLIRERLKKAALLGAPGKQLPRFAVSIAGRSGGRGGADYSVTMTLAARVPSPFAKDRTISAIVWHAGELDHQLMFYDAAARKIPIRLALFTSAWNPPCSRCWRRLSGTCEEQTCLRDPIMFKGSFADDLPTSIEGYRLEWAARARRGGIGNAAGRGFPQDGRR